MKAIVVSNFGDESVLHYQEAPLPEPAVNEVRVRMASAGVNPVETYIRAGKYGTLPSLPYTPGNDGAGVIDAIGRDVRELRSGQRVFIAAAKAKHATGTYAEYMVCDAKAVRPLPDGFSYSQGAGLGTPGLAAACALFSRGKLVPGETVLVHGATGGVGTLAVQLARQAGATVIGTSGSSKGLGLLQKLGAHMTFNHAEEGYIERIRAALPAGPDLVVEMLANVNLARDISLIKTHGRVVVVGNKGSLDFNPRDLMTKDATVNGMLINNMSGQEFNENMFRLSAALENGLKVIVDEELPLERAAEAHKKVAAGNKAGKIVLLCGKV